MNVNKLVLFYLNNFLDELFRENWTVFILGDFNLKFLNDDQDPLINRFLYSVSLNVYLLHIFQPERVRTNSKFFIETLFSNAISPNIITGKLTSHISDKLTKFFNQIHFTTVMPNIFLKLPSLKPNIYERVRNSIDQENLFLEYCFIDWGKIMCVNNEIMGDNEFP